MELESIANLFAYTSLVCSLSFWVWAILSLIPGAPRLELPGLWWLTIMGLGGLLAVAAVIAKAKLRFVALPVSVAMFFFVMYVNGS